MRYLLYLSLIFLQASAIAQQKPGSAPNVLVIIADDMSKHAGIYGDKAVRTPGINALGAAGIVFENAFCTASSCTPSRASILTGKYPHELKEGGNLWSALPVSFPNYTRLLAENGYRIGSTGKGWGPGNYEKGGYSDNPAGPSVKSFDEFISGLPENTPFCFWIGSRDPHRPYDPELKKTANSNTKEIRVPAWLPDNEPVREDMLDYYAEVNRFDKTVESAIALLKKEGLYDNTLIIVTSDNGMPFPRAKANVYDGGSNIPLIMRWGNHFKNGTRYRELVSLVDLAPTILDVADVSIPGSLTGKSLLPLLVEGKTDNRFKAVFMERERHADIRKGSLGYPVRAIRTPDFLYIVNLRPERWAAGDPDVSRGPGPYGDIDDGLSKQFLIDNLDNNEFKALANLSLGKRSAEELYDLRKDPDQLHNVIHDPSYKKVKAALQKQLSGWRTKTGDPVTNSGTDIFDTYPYYNVEK